MSTFSDEQGNPIFEITNDNLPAFKKWLKEGEQQAEKAGNYSLAPDVKLEDAVSGYNQYGEDSKRVLLALPVRDTGEFMDVAHKEPEYTAHRMDWGRRYNGYNILYQNVVNSIKYRTVEENLPILAACRDDECFYDGIGKHSSFEKPTSEQERYITEIMRSRSARNNRYSPGYQLLNGGFLDNYPTSEQNRAYIDENIANTETWGNRRDLRLENVRPEMMSDRLMGVFLTSSLTSKTYWKNKKPMKTLQDKKNANIVDRKYLQFRDVLLRKVKDTQVALEAEGRVKSQSAIMNELYERLTGKRIYPQSIDNTPDMVKEAYMATVKSDIKMSFEASKTLEKEREELFELNKKRDEVDKAVKEVIVNREKELTARQQQLEKELNSAEIRRDEYAKKMQEKKNVEKELQEIKADPTKNPEYAKKVEELKEINNALPAKVALVNALETKSKVVENLAPEIIARVLSEDKDRTYAKMLPPKMADRYLDRTGKLLANAENLSAQNIYELEGANISSKEKKALLKKAKETVLPKKKKDAEIAKTKIDTFDEDKKRENELQQQSNAAGNAYSALYEVQEAYHRIVEKFVDGKPSSQESKVLSPEAIEKVLTERVKGNKSARVELPDFGRLPLIFGKEAESRRRGDITSRIDDLNRKINRYFVDEPLKLEELAKYSGKMLDKESANTAYDVMYETIEKKNTESRNFSEKHGNYSAWDKSNDERTIIDAQSYEQAVSDSLARIESKQKAKKELVKEMLGVPEITGVKAVTEDMTVADVKATRAANKEVRDKLKDKEASMNGKSDAERLNIQKNLVKNSSRN